MLQVEQRCPNHPDWLVVTWRAAGGFGENRNNEEIAKLAEYDLRIEWDLCREGCKAVKDPTTLRKGCEAKRLLLDATAPPFEHGHSYGALAPLLGVSSRRRLA